MEWYNPQKMLSHNALLNMIIGARGIGKTFSMKKYLLNQFKTKGKPFIYLRRNKTELDELDKDKFFTDELLGMVFKDFEIIDRVVTSRGTTLIFYSSDFDEGENKLQIASNKITLNGKIVCYMKSLSTWVNLKGSEYDDVDNILFDEVLIDTTSRKQYLKNEVLALYNLLFSVFRRRSGVRCFLLSNATNFNNPYFHIFGFNETKINKRFYKLRNNSILLEFPPESSFKNEEEEKNPLFYAMKGTQIFDSVVHNEFQIKQTDNVEKLKGIKYPVYNLYTDNSFITVFSMGDIIYLKKGFNKDLSTFCFNIDDVENGFIFIDRQSPISKSLRKHFYNNQIIYDNIEVKNRLKEDLVKVI